MTQPTNATSRESYEERVLRRAVALMRKNGYGRGVALKIARESVKKEQASE